MKKINYLFIFIMPALIYSCTSSDLKENINKTGNAAGEVIGEFATGVTTGVKKVIEPKYEISENLKSQGISFGKMTIAADSLGNDDILIAYTIFNSDFTGKITATAFDNSNLEMGRVKISVKGKKEETQFIEFHFDKRTEINNDSKIILE